jgi:hypothetical protein
VKNSPAKITLTDTLSGFDLDPIPRHIYLRHILGLPQGDPELRYAADASLSSKWCRLLESEQMPDGSWWRLHSADSRLGRAVPTTEFGVERGRALSLDGDHPVMKKAARFLETVLTGDTEIRDLAEKNDRWQYGIELFAAATLARIEPTSDVLDRAWDKWSQIARCSVRSGTYQEKDELESHHSLTGVSTAGSYLRLSSKYALALLAFRVGEIPSSVEQALFQWIWNRADGIGYYGQQVCEPPRPGSFTVIEMWFRSHELLSLFPSWRSASKDIITWLLGCRTSEGLWDFGPRSPMSAVLPFSESWRRRRNRQIDWTLRVLLLLMRANVDLGEEL